MLAASLSELAAKGYGGFSLAAVAEAAGTTRPAIYRRWKDKASLIVDAVARLAGDDAPALTGQPFVDLVEELTHFRHCITEAGSLPLAGLMLGDEVDPAVRAAYQERIVAPRRARLRAILTAGVECGELHADADLDIAGSFFTGSWYSLSIAGRPVPRDWARRVATIVWRSCGGVPPSAPR